jgi:hypothetical protein
MLPDEEVVRRFRIIAKEAFRAGLRRVYVTFLQPNDLVPETRTFEARRGLLKALAKSFDGYVVLCQDDRTLDGYTSDRSNLVKGICESGSSFGNVASKLRCGCTQAVDPFTLAAKCRYGCKYCYAADQNLAGC